MMVAAGMFLSVEMFAQQKLTGKVVALPAREDIDLTIAEHLIIELYSK